MSQTLVTNIFRKTGEIGRPTKMLAYRLKISFVAKSIYRFPSDPSAFDAGALLPVPIYSIFADLGNLLGNKRSGQAAQKNVFVILTL